MFQSQHYVKTVRLSRAAALLGPRMLLLGVACRGQQGTGADPVPPCSGYGRWRPPLPRPCQPPHLPWTALTQSLTRLDCTNSCTWCVLRFTEQSIDCEIQATGELPGELQTPYQGTHWRSHSPSTALSTLLVALRPRKA